MIHLGDNLAILRSMPAASVDLVYLDPPFNSGRDYGEGALAFSDTWVWGPDSERAVRALKSSSRLGRLVAGLFLALGESPTMAYVAFMAERLVELRRVMRETATIYVHVDPTASPVLRLMLDAIFGAEHFRNEVVWRYRRWPTHAKRFQRMHDTLLVYTKSDAYTFHTLHGYEDLAESTKATFGTKKQRADFSSGKRRGGQEDVESDGPPLSDVWDVSVLAPIARERTGYPTQKPERLLERVVLASSNPGDVVLDPFCGSGTTCAVAARLGREAIGIDRNPAAVDIARERIAKSSASKANPPRVA